MLQVREAMLKGKTLPEAAKAAGVAASTLRHWISNRFYLRDHRNGEINWEKYNRHLLPHAHYVPAPSTHGAEDLYGPCPPLTFFP